MDDPPSTAGLVPRRGKSRERAWNISTTSALLDQITAWALPPSYAAELEPYPCPHPRDGDSRLVRYRSAVSAWLCSSTGASARLSAGAFL
jgi:hypothetical protein